MLHRTDINAANFKERVIILTMYQFMTKDHRQFFSTGYCSQVGIF